MNEDAERRIEAAAEEQRRAKEMKEFLDSLTANDTLVKPIYNPEAYVMREKFRGAAGRGELPRTQCTHPFQAIQQYIDEDPAIDRRGRPVNLFECVVCHTPLWLIDPWGNAVTDD